MEKGQTIGEPTSTVFSFTRDGSKLTADARLLGTMGAVQTLVLDIVFTDGGRTQRTEVDLTEALADFNGDMTTAYRVTEHWKPRRHGRRQGRNYRLGNGRRW